MSSLPWPLTAAFIGAAGAIFGILVGGLFAAVEAGLIFVLWGRASDANVSTRHDTQRRLAFFALPPAIQQAIAWGFMAGCFAAFQAYRVHWMSGKFGVVDDRELIPHFLITVAPFWAVGAIIIGRSHYLMARIRLVAPAAAAWCTVWIGLSIVLFIFTFLFLAVAAHVAAGGIE